MNAFRAQRLPISQDIRYRPADETDNLDVDIVVCVCEGRRPGCRVPDETNGAARSPKNQDLVRIGDGSECERKAGHLSQDDVLRAQDVDVPRDRMLLRLPALEIDLPLEIDVLPLAVLTDRERPRQVILEQGVLCGSDVVPEVHVEPSFKPVRRRRCST